MADILSAIPQLITAGADGQSHEIQFDAGEFNTLLPGITQVAFIRVVSGVLKVNVGGPCSETGATFTGPVDLPPIPFINGTKNIFYEFTTGGSAIISAI